VYATVEPWGVGVERGAGAEVAEATVEVEEAEEEEEEEEEEEQEEEEEEDAGWAERETWAGIEAPVLVRGRRPGLRKGESPVVKGGGPMVEEGGPAVKGGGATLVGVSVSFPCEGSYRLSIHGIDTDGKSSNLVNSPIYITVGPPDLDAEATLILPSAAAKINPSLYGGRARVGGGPAKGLGLRVVAGQPTCLRMPALGFLLGGGGVLGSELPVVELTKLRAAAGIPQGGRDGASEENAAGGENGAWGENTAREGEEGDAGWEGDTEGGEYDTAGGSVFPHPLRVGRTADGAVACWFSLCCAGEYDLSITLADGEALDGSPFLLTVAPSQLFPPRYIKWPSSNITTITPL